MQSLRSQIRNVWDSFVYKNVPYKDNVIVLLYKTGENGLPIYPLDRLQNIYDSVKKKLPKEAVFIMLPDKITAESCNIKMLETIRDRISELIEKVKEENNQE